MSTSLTLLTPPSATTSSAPFFLGESNSPEVVRICDGPVFDCNQSPDPASCNALIADLRTTETAAKLWKALRREGDFYQACSDLEKCPDDTACKTALSASECANESTCDAINVCSAECYNCYRLVSEWPVFQEACLPQDAIVPNELEHNTVADIHEYTPIVLPGAPPAPKPAMDSEEADKAVADADAAVDSITSDATEASLLDQTRSRVTAMAAQPLLQTSAALGELAGVFSSRDELDYQTLSLRLAAHADLPLYSHQYDGARAPAASAPKGLGPAAAASLMEAGESESIRSTLAAQEALAAYRSARAAVAKIRAAKAEVINTFALSDQPSYGAGGASMMETDAAAEQDLQLGVGTDVDSLPDPFAEGRAAAASYKHAQYLSASRARPPARGFSARDAQGVFLELGTAVRGNSDDAVAAKQDAAQESRLQQEATASQTAQKAKAEDQTIDYAVREPRCWSMWKELGEIRRARFFMSYKKTTMPSLNPDDMAQGLGWDAHSVCKCLQKCPMDPGETLQMANSCKYTRAHEFLMKVAFPTLQK